MCNEGNHIIKRLETTANYLKDVSKIMEATVNEAIAELRAHDQLFDIQHKRSLEAQKLWRKETGVPENAIPDLGKLIEFLIGRGNQVISQKKMNEIIDNIASEYPVEIFPRPTAQETNKLPYDVRRYIGRISANMARVTCTHIKKELEQYFKEINSSVVR